MKEVNVYEKVVIWWGAYKGQKEGVENLIYS